MEKDFYLGIDIGGTKCAVVVGDDNFKIRKKIQFETSFTVRSPGFEFNDIGYMRYSDVIHHGSWLAYYVRNPFSIFNNFDSNKK